MMRKILFIAFSFIFTWAYAQVDQQFLLAQSQLETLIKNNESQVLVPSRNMQIRLYPHRTTCVALVLHGLFQSPKDMQGLINYFYEKRGCNVVAPLLAAHWSKDRNAFYKISYETWKQQITEILRVTQKLGDQIILVGHSTGGLLALDKIINFSEFNFSQAILFAPAIKLQNSVVFGSKFGAFFKMDQNSVSDESTNASEYDLQMRPAVAGVHVQNLIENIFGRNQETRWQAYAKIHIPLLLISTENDSTIQHNEVVNLKNTNPILFKLIAYPKNSILQHDNIQRSVIDVEPNSPQEWVNPYYEGLIKQIDQFLN